MHVADSESHLKPELSNAKLDGAADVLVAIVVCVLSSHHLLLLFVCVCVDGLDLYCCSTALLQPHTHMSSSYTVIIRNSKSLEGTTATRAAITALTCKACMNPILLL